MAKVKLKKGLVSKLLIVAFITIGTLLIIASVKKITGAYQLKVEVNEAKKQLEALQVEYDYLINQKEKLQDDEYVSSWARGKYNLTKSGEDVFQLPSGN